MRHSPRSGAAANSGAEFRDNEFFGLPPPDSTGETLTRQQAEQLALKNNPRISVAALLALAQKQVVRETRSALLPTLNGNLTGVDAEEASRISAGSLAPPGFSITWAQGLTSLS